MASLEGWGIHAPCPQVTPRKEDALPSACLTPTHGWARDDGDVRFGDRPTIGARAAAPVVRSAAGDPPAADADGEPRPARRRRLAPDPDHQMSPSGDDPTDVWSGLADATPDDGAIASCRAEPRRDRVMARRLVRAHVAHLPVRGIGGVVEERCLLEVSDVGEGSDGDIKRGRRHGGMGLTPPQSGGIVANRSRRCHGEQ